MERVLNADLAKVEQDALSVLSMLPKAGQIKFRSNVIWLGPLRIKLPFSFNKTYKLRPFALKDRIRLAEKYGEKKLVDIFSDPNSVKFIEIHADIILHAMSEKDQRDFGSLDKFLERIDGPAKEVEMLLIALELRGVAENPKLTEEELKEVLEGIKKKVDEDPDDYVLDWRQIEYDFLETFGKDYNWLIEQPENKIYQLIREKRKREIAAEMERILRQPNGEKAIESLDKDHPVRREYVRIRMRAREKELKEHRRIREQIKKAKEGKA